MTPERIIRRLRATLDGIDVLAADGDRFLYFNPDDGRPKDHRMPFATIVTSDRHDAASDLDRDVGSFRLNVGLTRETYRRLFGEPPAFRTDGGFAETGHDFGQRDVLMPHPVYAAMHWVCVVNPSDATFERLAPLLAEAHAAAVAARAARATAERTPKGGDPSQ